MHESARPLLTPDEVMRLQGPEKDRDDRITKAGDVLLFVKGYPAIRARQALYFFDPTFLARAIVELLNPT
jgi:type IV secretion system protein VirD4